MNTIVSSYMLEQERTDWLKRIQEVKCLCKNRFKFRSEPKMILILNLFLNLKESVNNSIQQFIESDFND